MNKKSITLTFVIVFVFSLLLTACGPATPVPGTADTFKIYPQLNQVAATEAEAKAIIAPLTDQATAAGLKSEIRAFTTEAKLEDLTAFYNDAYKDWTASPAEKDSTGKITTVKYSQASGETFAIIYTPNDPPAKNFVVVLMHLWK